MRVTKLLLTIAATLTTMAIGAAQRPLPPPPGPPPPPLPMAAILKAYPPVTADRLLKPADGDWLMIRRTYDGWGYSPLDQITPANVARLQPVWILSTGAINGHEAPALVNGGVMFVSTPGNQVIAVEAKTGRFLGAIAGRSRKTPSSCTRPRAASRSTATRCSSRPTKACWWRSTREPARKCGLRMSATTRAATT